MPIRYKRLETTVPWKNLAMAKTKSPAKKCLHCNKVLKGRADKQFCDIICKNAYHNADLADGEKIYKRVLKILRKNRNVLKAVLGEKSSIEIEMEKLIAQGFDNDYLTHSKESTPGKRYYYCFDYGYRMEPNGKAKVVKSFNWTI